VSSGGRRPGNRTRTLLDLFLNAATGQLMEPPETPISTPLAQGVSGLQGIMPGLMSQAFGPNRGLLSMLTGYDQPTPSFGAVPSREELGLGHPETAPPGFLPPTEQVMDALPSVRRTRANTAGQRLEQRRDRRAAAGKSTAKQDKKLAKREQSPGYVGGR
jgi:hypothetical protein